MDNLKYTENEILKNKKIIQILTTLNVKQIDNLFNLLSKFTVIQSNIFFQFIDTLNNLEKFYLRRFFQKLDNFLCDVMTNPISIDDHSH